MVEKYIELHKDGEIDERFLKSTKGLFNAMTKHLKHYEIGNQLAL
jgi:hypothetical protein